MERTNIYLEKSQKEELKEHHKKTGICPAEAVREAIDLYLKKGHDKIKRKVNKAVN